MEIKLNYNDHEIIFDKNEEVMVNATQMAKAFGKRIDFFLKAEHTKAFMEVAEFPPYGGNSEGSKKRELVVTKGHLGTWMHRVLAIKFAAWLDPKFEFWVYSTIEEILFGNQFKAVRNWYDETTIITNREREIKLEFGRLKYSIKKLPIVIDRKLVVKQLKELESDMRLKEIALSRSLDAFTPSSPEKLVKLVEDKRLLGNEIADKRKELEKLNEEYRKLDAVIEMEKLSLERSTGSRRKAKLTKELYHGQLVVL